MVQVHSSRCIVQGAMFSVHCAWCQVQDDMFLGKVQCEVFRVQCFFVLLKVQFQGALFENEEFMVNCSRCIVQGAFFSLECESS